MYEKAMAVIAIALFTALLVTLWLRDRLRRAVCRAADPHMRNSTQEREWLVTYEKFLYSSAQTQRISVLKRNLPQLPAEVQAEIAMRVGNLIELAKPVSDALLQRFAEVARQEQLLAVHEGAKRDTDPLWAAPAISEAWCNARLGLTNGNLSRHSAAAIIAAVESFTSKRTGDLQRTA